MTSFSIWLKKGALEDFLIKGLNYAKKNDSDYILIMDTGDSGSFGNEGANHIMSVEFDSVQINAECPTTGMEFQAFIYPKDFTEDTIKFILQKHPSISSFGNMLSDVIREHPELLDSIDVEELIILKLEPHVEVDKPNRTKTKDSKKPQVSTL